MDSSSSRRQKLGLLDLPLENQAEIVDYVPSKALFSLQVSSKHFHNLASARIYRSLVFFLSHPDAPQYYRESHYRLADALQTFATSDYDYAQHVKKFRLQMSENDSEDAQKRIASRYHVSEEPTMLLNMALLLTIKKARSIESFSWDVPVELSPNVYEALSKIASLQCLQVRLDIASITRISTIGYGPPPPPGPDLTQQIANAQYFPPMPGGIPNAWPPSAFASVAALNKSKLTRMRIERRRFSNFHNLRELRVIAIDSLDCLDQIKVCLSGSARTVRTLSLSLSHGLVRRARKVSSNSQSHGPGADQVDEDDAMTEPNTPDTNVPVPAAPNEADIKRERQAQELTLARVFGFEKPANEDRKLDKLLKATAKSVKLTETESDKLGKLQQNLQAVVNSAALSSSDRLEIQELIKKINESLKKAVSGRPLQSKPKLKGHKKGPGHKSKTSISGWAQPPLPFPHDVQNWESLPPLPPVGTSSKGPPKSVPYFYTSNSKNGGNPNNGTVLGDLFGTGSSSMGDVLADAQLIPTSQAPNGQYAPPNPKVIQGGFSFAPPKFPPPSQPPLFSTTAYSNSQSGTVSPPLYFVEDSLLLQMLQGVLPHAQPCSNHPHHTHHAASQSSANLLGQNNGKTSVHTSSAPDLHDAETDSDTSSMLDEDDGPKNVIASTQADPVNGDKALESESDIDMDIDMDHPDVDGQSDDNDAGSEGSEMSVAEEGTAAQGNGLSTDGIAHESHNAVALKENVPLVKEDTGANKEPTKVALTQKDFLDGTLSDEEKSDISRSASKSRDPEAIMQEYIRSTHGFSLEEFSLYLVPLKSSILIKALNLSCLRRLILYSVGPQGAFWTALEKSLEQGSGLSLHVIRTDDVSNAFVRCVSKLSGLKQLHLTRRSTKDFDSTTTKAPATLDEVRKLILNRHLVTLESLALANFEDDKWDLNGKCLRLMAARGKKLKELACSMDNTNFHIFIQCLPGLRNLEAINFLMIRTNDRGSSLNRECRKFIIDVLHYRPELKLKYMAMGSLVYQLSAKPKMSLPDWLSKQEQALSSRSAKGKGKAVERFNEDMTAQGDSEELSDIEEARPNVFVAKHWKLNEVPDHYAIFSTEVRKARL